MNAEVIRTFRFDAAHRLLSVPAGHRFANLHGHSYRVDVHVSGPVDERTGWVMDFGHIKELVEPVLSQLDHHCLNDVPGLPNSTSEMIAKFLFDRISPVLQGLSAVVVWESDTSRAVYRG